MKTMEQVVGKLDIERILEAARQQTQAQRDNKILRRIARVAPTVLAAYERGEFSSINEAAQAAGIVRRSPMADVRRAWNRAVDRERQTIVEWINDQIRAAKR